MPSIDIIDAPSPNHGARGQGQSIDILLLHYTGMAAEEGALAWLRDPRSQVSAHYFVFEDGRVARLVTEELRAWHAGRSFWGGETDINSRSIGIEIANPGHEFGYRAFPETQIDAVIRLCREVLSRHPIPAHRVLAHSDVAPARKEDPGELFPWQRLAEHGVGHWTPPDPIRAGPFLRGGDAGAGVGALKQRFRRYGYGLTEDSSFDESTEAVVTAFQRHFRQQKVDGVADVSTVTTLERLLAGVA